MTESRKTTGRNLRDREIGAAATDLAVLDAHIPEPDDDAPEFTLEESAHGMLHKAGKRLGRPKAAVTKERVTLRLDPDLLGYFRNTGTGWQTRINQALRRAVKLKF